MKKKERTWLITLPDGETIIIFGEKKEVLKEILELFFLKKKPKEWKIQPLYKRG